MPSRTSCALSLRRKEEKAKSVPAARKKRVTPPSKAAIAAMKAAAVKAAADKALAAKSMCVQAVARLQSTALVARWRCQLKAQYMCSSTCSACAARSAVHVQLAGGLGAT